MSMIAPAALTLSGLSDNEQRTLTGLRDLLVAKQTHNTLVSRYYEGKQRVRDLGIAIPPHMRNNVEEVIGWPGTAVDVLEERLDIDGWSVPGFDDDLGLSEIIDANRLRTEYSEGHLDALIYGIAYITVGTGRTGEPNPLITVESPTWMTADWNRRSRKVDAALSVTWGEDGQVRTGSLYLPDQTVRVEMSQGVWRVVDRDEHNLGDVPVYRLVNRPRRGDPGGRSEITRAVRAYTDNAVRTLLGMEVAREFFSSPQRYILGADEKSFMDAEGNPKTAWETYLGRVLALTADENGNKPEVGTFAASSPAPYLEQIRGLAQLLAAEAAIPPSYLGIIHDNPSSADAIRAGEARLVKRAERRHSTFGATWGDAMRMALRFMYGTDPGVTPRPDWRDAATPTRAAAADEAVKLVSVGILPPDSEVTQKRVGLTEVDRGRLADHTRRLRAQRNLEALASLTDGTDDLPAV